jgi:hypothetical protein
MTFETTPLNYQSVNDPIVYVVYDANAIDGTKLDYKYIAECWINGTKVFTAREYPRPDNNRGVFDFATVIREYITPTLTTDLGSGEWWVSVEIKIREYYNTTVSSVVATSSARVFMNHYNGRINEFTKLDDYVNKPLSNRPTTIVMKTGTTKYYIPYFANSASSFNVTINGSTTAVTPAAANSLININIANNLTADYTVVINGITYNVKVICESLYRNYYVHFLNKWGGFESMLFNMVSKKSIDIEKKSYQQLPYRVSGAGVVSVIDSGIMHEQKTTFASTFKEKLRISTNWLDDSEYVWLAELMVSPMIYLEDTDGTFYPVQISNSTYEFKEHFVDRLSNLTIDLDFNTSFKTQFR